MTKKCNVIKLIKIQLRTNRLDLLFKLQKYSLLVKYFFNMARQIFFR